MFFSKHVAPQDLNPSQQRGDWQIILERQGFTHQDATALINGAEAEYGGDNNLKGPHDYMEMTVHHYNLRPTQCGPAVDMQSKWVEDNEDLWHGDGAPVKKGWFW